MGRGCRENGWKGRQQRVRMSGDVQKRGDEEREEAERELGRIEVEGGLLASATHF